MNSHEWCQQMRAEGFQVSGNEKHLPSKALGLVHVVRIMKAKKAGQTKTERFCVSSYPLYLYIK